MKMGIKNSSLPNFMSDYTDNKLSDSQIDRNPSQRQRTLISALKQQPLSSPHALKFVFDLH